MDSDKKKDGNNIGMMIGIGLIVLFILAVLLFNDPDLQGVSQLDVKPNNFGFSLEDAFNIMK